jgi:hypothetical protein
LTDTLDKSETALSGLNTLARKADVIKKDIDSISTLFKG